MRPCPNCSQSVADDAALCPNCGAETAPIWPPTPEGQPPPPLTDGRSKEWSANQVLNGFCLSCVVGFVVWVAAWIYLLGNSLGMSNPLPHLPGFLIFSMGWGPTLVIQTAWYFLIRSTRPYFARGVGYSILVSLACLLGGFTLCYR